MISPFFYKGSENNETFIVLSHTKRQITYEKMITILVPGISQIG